MSTVLRAACVQMCAGSDVQGNLDLCADLVEQARACGATLVALPENFAYMGPEQDRLAIAETLPMAGSDAASGPIGRWLSAVSRLHGIHLVASGLPERSDDPQKSYNTSVYFGPDGKLVTRYRKIHLFDVDLSDGTKLVESRSVAPGGDGAVSVDTPYGSMGLAICYDVRFPELFRALSRQGMRFLVIGAAFTLHTGRDHWLTLLKARAIENQVYVVAPAQWGAHGGGRVSFGRSVIVDPWGIELSIAPDRNGVIVADLDFATQDKVRRELPVLEHRRLS